jgi:hypothetical protein
MNYLILYYKLFYGRYLRNIIMWISMIQNELKILHLDRYCIPFFHYRRRFKAEKCGDPSE